MATDVYGEGGARAYDAAYAVARDPSGDARFYLDLARETGGPVLELGCGTGRVLLPIARAGIPCVGIDRSAAMLDQLRVKGVPANLELFEEDITRFDLGERRFRFIYAAFRVFQHLEEVDEQLACLERARRHLAPGGRFALDVFSPDLARLAAVEEPEHLELEYLDGADRLRRHVSVRRDHARQVQRVRFRLERHAPGGPRPEEAWEFTMRWFYRYELEHLLVRAGLRPEAWYGGFDRRPYDATAEIIVVCQSAG